MHEQYIAVLRSPVTDLGANWLYKAHLVMRIAGDDLIAAAEAAHSEAGHEAALRERDELSEEERVAIGKEVGAHWALCVTVALERLWHAARVINVDPHTISTDHITLTAATLLKESPESLASEAA